MCAYCNNCNSHVTDRYARVFAPETDPDEVRCCPNCEDRIRDPDGTVRDARSTRHNGSGNGETPAPTKAEVDA
jgi:hypothetical protein